MRKKTNSIKLDKIRSHKERVLKIRDREAKKKIYQEESKQKAKIVDKQRVTSPVRKVPNSSGKPVIAPRMTHTR